jgi:hypothetical protein
MPELEAHSTALQSLHTEALRLRLVSEIGNSLSQVNELDGAGERLQTLLNSQQLWHGFPQCLSCHRNPSRAGARSGGFA